QYFFIDHTLIDQMTKQAQQESGGIPQLTEEDIVEIAKTVGNVNREYLFTTDESKAVLIVKSQVGRETFEGRDTFHYKVGFDKPHLKAYLNNLKEALKNTKLKDLIKDENFDEMIKSVDDIKDDSEADVWVDMKTKLIRTVRFTDPDNKETYFDIGMKYTGGDEYPFYFAINDEETGSATLEITVNTDTSAVNLNLDSSLSQGAETVKITANIDFAPSNDKLEFNKP